MELSLWEQDVKEELNSKGLTEAKDAQVLCEKCGIPLITRTNRVSKEDFLGCIRFPECRVTLPLTSAGLDVKQVLKNKKDEKTENPRRNPQSRKRTSQEKRHESDGSWVPVQTDSDMDETKGDDTSKQFNTNVSAKEMEVIMQMREFANSSKGNVTLM